MAHDQVPSNSFLAVGEALKQRPEWELLRRQIVKHGIAFGEHLMFDLRKMLTFAKNAEMAGRLMWELIKPFRPEVLVGPGFGATPLLYGTALAASAEGVHLSVLMVRDKRKEHNQKKWVEGHRPRANSRAVMLDDFMEAGSAVGLVQEALASDKIVLDLVAVALFFDMWQPLGSRQLMTGRFKVTSLFKRHDVGLSRDCFDAVPPKMTGIYPDFIDVADPLWWRFHLNEKTDYPLKGVPVIADNAVFVTDDHANVWRHDGLTGNIEWCYSSLADPLKGIPEIMQYVDGSLVFGCYDGTITRLDAKTGDVIWRWRQDSSIHATPELDLPNGRLFVNTEQYNDGKPFGHLQALDWKTGDVLWKYAHPYWPPATTAYDPKSDIVTAPCNDETLVGVEAKTGRRLWTQKTEGLVRGRPGIGDGRVIVATERGRLHAFDVATGKPAWTTRYGKSEGHQWLHTDRGVVFVLDGKWHFTGFSIATGEIKWLARLRSAGVWGPTTFGRYLIVLSKDGHIAVFDPELELKVWESSVKAHYRQPGAVGWLDGPDGTKTPVFAVASNYSGLRVHRIHPQYAKPEPFVSPKSAFGKPQLDGAAAAASGKPDKLPERTRAHMEKRRAEIRAAGKRIGPADEVPAFHSLDRETYLRRGAAGKPYLVKGFAKNWPLGKLTKDQLLAQFGKMPVVARTGDYVGTAFSPKREMVKMSLADYFATVSAGADLPPYLGNQDLPQLAGLCDWPDFFDSSVQPKIWLGVAGTVTPLHCDFDDNLFIQLWGSKHFRMYPPHDHEHLYVREANPALHASRFDPEVSDFETFPAAKHATQVECVVEEGDLLYVPSGWFHHVRALTLSLSANRWTHERPLAVQGHSEAP
jgi:outer membrane protein assembly factor BamB/orotate phosphoribosyltransferase